VCIILYCAQKTWCNEIYGYLRATYNPRKWHNNWFMNKKFDFFFLSSYYQVMQLNHNIILINYLIQSFTRDIHFNSNYELIDIYIQIWNLQCIFYLNYWCIIYVNLFGSEIKLCFPFSILYIILNSINCHYSTLKNDSTKLKHFLFKFVRKYTVTTGLYYFTDFVYWVLSVNEYYN